MFAGLLIALTLLLGAVFVVHYYVDYRAQRTRSLTTNVPCAVPMAAWGFASRYAP
jgi:hypothetical protein